jgi:glycosyltransferase involved in cell wall biosynthesis
MACGTPVIASNTSSLPEVLGDAAILVTPTDIPALTSAMERVLTDRVLSDELSERGLVRSQQFSWDKTARETLAVYEQVAGLVGGRSR